MEFVVAFRWVNLLDLEVGLEYLVIVVILIVLSVMVVLATFAINCVAL